MATCLRQLNYLLRKNVTLKYRNTLGETIAEFVTVLSFPVILVVVWKIVLHPNYDAIPCSEQKRYNVSEIPGGKKHHLGYVTNVDASEFQFFLWFYSLTLLI